VVAEDSDAERFFTRSVIQRRWLHAGPRLSIETAVLGNISKGPVVIPVGA
jgi:hypothetical protein